ncbi:MAG: ribonuclease HI [Oscillospiraceae bacterium]
MKTVELFTDGACKGNPGPGGWCAILRYNEKECVVSGGEKDTTNNRMELSAVLFGLKALKEPCKVILTSDSKYVLDSISKGWVYSWQKKGWKKSDGKPALNVDLWQQLLPEIKKHDMSYNWIKGHNGHDENERCDALAVAESEKFVK